MKYSEHIKIPDMRISLPKDLITNLNTLTENVKRGFSFVVIVSGQGKVRVGKTVMANICAKYCANKLNMPFSVDDVCFSTNDLKTKVETKNPYGVFMLDESRADLGRGMSRTKTLNIMLDWFSESGKYNSIVFLVLPDFFDLNTSLAVSFSEYLINCFVRKEPQCHKEPLTDHAVHERGYFSFYGDRAKYQLHWKGRDKRNYFAHTPEFGGYFPDAWFIDEAEYNRRKDAHITRIRNVAEDTKPVKYKEQRNALIHVMHTTCKLSNKKIAEALEQQGIILTEKAVSVITAIKKKEKKVYKLEGVSESTPPPTEVNTNAIHDNDGTDTAQSSTQMRIEHEGPDTRPHEENNTPGSPGTQQISVGD
jgi:hypothetical protein